ncbi:MAG: hypothetical protein LAO22_22795 [Acidobacteriia bacterium]|nr:hypothetical protein [Terriglobia bacterium]MBZ5652698.1 hypothetical protein [Terriglobia bacterium]MBZ5658548.1 hypothetical protein [Terriglobia bacterium]
MLEKMSKELGYDLADSDVLFDVPKIGKTHDMLPALYVRDPDGHYRILTDLSGVVASLCQEFENLTKKSRIYVSPLVREKLNTDKKEADRIENAFRDFLSLRAKKES